MKRIQHKGTTVRDRLINNTLDSCKKLSINSPNYHEIIINDNKIGVMILETDEFNVKEFISYEYKDIYSGEYVEWDNSYWLITDADFNSELSRHCKMQRCNNILSWQNPITKKIVQRRYIADTAYTMDINPVYNRNYIPTSNKVFRIILPRDEETLLIDLDRRFLLDMANNQPQAYKVIGVNSLSKFVDNGDIGGCIVVDLEHEHYNSATDNGNLMIADYVENFDIEDDVSSRKSNIVGSNTLKIGGIAKTFKAEFFEEDGFTENTAVQAKWSIDCDSETEKFVTYNIDGNSVVVQIKDGLNHQSVINLTLCDSENLYPPYSHLVSVVNVL